ncbi:hypothetical protein AcV7_002149 [Taiwanofungus camphoratus]|nr:hypothetical protein AcV7_002149 [Antrodia cinnamomea]
MEGRIAGECQKLLRALASHSNCLQHNSRAALYQHSTMASALARFIDDWRHYLTMLLPTRPVYSCMNTRTDH